MDRDIILNSFGFFVVNHRKNYADLAKEERNYVQTSKRKFMNFLLTPIIAVIVITQLLRYLFHRDSYETVTPIFC